MYNIYDWHNGGRILGENMTLEQVMNFYTSNNYRYIKIDMMMKDVFVTNCCWFTQH